MSLMFSCKEITEKANEYVDQELPLFTRLRVKLHLQMCKHCQRYVEQLHLTIQVLGKMHQDITISDEAVDSVLHHINVQRQQDD